MHVADDIWYWRRFGRRYHASSVYWRRLFGRRVKKVSLDIGCGCPNRDGTVGREGCVFCRPETFSRARREGWIKVSQQFEVVQNDGRNRCQGPNDPNHRGNASVATPKIAYFQAGTNTYGMVEKLTSAYEEALCQPDVVGMIVGTRPDCLPDPLLDYFEHVAQRTWLMVELGVQSLSDRSLAWMNRGHDAQTTIEAVSRLRSRQLRVGAHLILGLPGETNDQMRQSACELSRLGVEWFKFHNLYAVGGTPLAEWVESGQIRLPTAEEHRAALIHVLEHLPPTAVVDRLIGDAPPEFLIGPAWCRRKSEFLNQLQQTMEETGSYQGRLHAIPSEQVA